MDFFKKHRTVLQILSFALFMLPSGIAGILFIYEKATGAEITMTTISILWFTVPPAIIGVIFLSIIVIQGRRPVELFDIEVSDAVFGTSTTNGFPKLPTGRILRINLGLNAMPTKEVGAIKLKLSGNLIKSNWEPDFVCPGVTTSGYVYFAIPDSIKLGEYTPKIIVYDKKDAVIKGITFNLKVPK